MRHPAKPLTNAMVAAMGYADERQIHELVIGHLTEVLKYNPRVVGWIVNSPLSVDIAFEQTINRPPLDPDLIKLSPEERALLVRVLEAKDLYEDEMPRLLEILDALRPPGERTE